ncbi:hypothetical protein EIP91_010142 [Steccherinum ochraceum]|uniref:Uncharacterized protein n=1 Tax=Steccherinum ochraceum TaxID=92696 RepID=A0A4R0RTY8_9APHY|nr:hypothetical protein EIP91_010142 [Steccherinum ochraceum]
MSVSTTRDTAPDRLRALLHSNDFIAFSLIPIELAEPYELFKTVHPTIWRIYDCTFGEYQVLTQQFNPLSPYRFQQGNQSLWTMKKGVSIFRKESDNFVTPVLSRIIPRGHYTALTTTRDDRPQWCDIARYKEAMPTTIIIINQSKTEQAFALCLAMTEKFEHAPRFAPIFCFDKIPNERQLSVKAEFQLRAYCGRGLKEMQQVHVGDNSSMKEVQDEFGNPWSVKLDDLPTMASFQISQNASGSISIKVEDTQTSNASKGMLEDVGQLKQKLEDFQKHVSRALGSDYLAVQRLRIEMQKITDKANTIRTEVNGTNGRIDGFGKEVEDVVTRVSECQEALLQLRAPSATRRDLAAQMDEVASTMQGMSQVQGSIKLMEEKMLGLEGLLRGLPKLQNNVGTLSTTVQTMIEDVGVIGNSVSSITKRVNKISDTSDNHEAKISAVEQAISIVRRNAVEVEEDVQSVSRSVQFVTNQLSEKADVNDLKIVQAEAGSATSMVRHIGEQAAQLQALLATMNGRVQRVEGSVAAVDETAKSLVSKIERVATKGSDDSDRLERDLSDVGKRVKEMEENSAARSETAALSSKLVEVESIAQDTYQNSTSVLRDVHIDSELLKQQIVALENSFKGLHGCIGAVGVVVRELQAGQEQRNIPSPTGSNFKLARAVRGKASLETQEHVHRLITAIKAGLELGSVIATIRRTGNDLEMEKLVQCQQQIGQLRSELDTTKTDFTERIEGLTLKTESNALAKSNDCRLCRGSDFDQLRSDVNILKADLEMNRKLTDARLGSLSSMVEEVAQSQQDIQLKMLSVMHETEEAVVSTLKTKADEYCVIPRPRL